jgi:hypothetical protein
MRPRDLIDHCERLGVTLTALGPDRLWVHAPDGVLSPEMRADLVAHKRALLALLPLEGAALQAERERFAAWMRERTPVISQSSVDAVEAAIRGDGVAALMARADAASAPPRCDFGEDDDPLAPPLRAAANGRTAAPAGTVEES